MSLWFRNIKFLTAKIFIFFTYANLCKLGDNVVNITFQHVEPPDQRWEDQICQVSFQISITVQYQSTRNDFQLCWTFWPANHRSFTGHIEISSDIFNIQMRIEFLRWTFCSISRTGICGDQVWVYGLCTSDAFYFCRRQDFLRSLSGQSPGSWTTTPEWISDSVCKKPVCVRCTQSMPSKVKLVRTWGALQLQRSREWSGLERSGVHHFFIGQGSFWPSANSAKTDMGKVNRCQTSSHKKPNRTPHHTG